VIDASALVELLLRSGAGERVQRAVTDARLVAPDVINPEVVQSLRGLERGGKLTSDRASKAIARLVESGISHVPTRVLLADMWSLRANLSSYDACYVALARLLRCPLLTSDSAMARAPGLDITVMRA
jgi:predicted nucleic acid-binding protein